MLRHRWSVSHVSGDSEPAYATSHEQNGSVFSSDLCSDPLFGSQTDSSTDCEVMASHDRTAEFVSVLRSIRGRQGLSAVPSAAPSAGSTAPALQRHGQFLNIARLIGRDISNTYAKLEKLALLAKRRSIFDDRPAEIQELTHIIRQDMTSLNQQILRLQQLSTASGPAAASGHVTSFSSNVVVVLQSKLAAMSSQFRRLLEQRTENMRSQRSRRDQFTCAGAAGAEGPVSGPPAQLRGQGSVLLSDEAAAMAGRGHTVLDMDGVRERHGLSQDQQQQQQQLLLQEEDSFYQSRSDTMKSIESTIVELGSIFQQLAHMVKEQEEVVQRIDTNVEDASVNVEAAHSEILKYFQSVSNNRWLMFKVFGVLIFFFLVFVLFLA
nr:syntaxin 5-like protein [Parasacculina yatsui]